jgi:hypothetical protein
LAPRSSTRSAAASNSRPSATAATRTTRCTTSAACSATAPSTSPIANEPTSTPACTPATPTWEVTVTWQCYQRLRGIYHQHTPAAGRRLAQQVIASLPTCPIPEVARLGRTLRAWRRQVLAYFHTGGVSNGGTEAIHLLVEKTRRLAHGYRNFRNHRLRILLAASGTRPYPQSSPNHA